jgi:UV DNA damage repair endonuclease
MGRVGFCCKYVAPHPKKIFESIDGFNTGTTTISWLKRQTRDVAEQRLWDLTVQNLEATRRLVEVVGGFDEQLRMVRLGSDILPAYTHVDWSAFYKRADVLGLLERGFAQIGGLARSKQVRLSFHPGQFTVLASENPGIVNNSIEEFEYHADMARWMGYGKSFQDFKINVHISGRRGPDGIREAYKRLSVEARNCITIENEENSWGLDDCLSISDIVPIVLDIHHNWIREGTYLDPSDARVARVIDSWRGVRPALHYSVSREDVLVGHSATVMPDMTSLLASGYKKQKLRAHSDFYWNSAVNDWAAGFAKDFDIQCESKCKNLASVEFAKLVNCH